MKKVIIFFTSLTLLSVFFGCNKKEVKYIKIEKVNGLTYELVDEIIEKYPNKETMDYIVYNIPTSRFKAYDSEYRIGFHFRLIPGTNENNQAIIDLCEKNEKLHVGKNHSFVNTVTKDMVSSYYIPVELLKEKGFLSTESTEQKDICIYKDTIVSLMSGDVHYKSNTITYTAEEINEFLDAHNLR